MAIMPQRHNVQLENEREGKDDKNEPEILSQTGNK